MTKHVYDDALKCHLSVEIVKVEVVPKLIDNTMVLGASNVMRKSKDKVKVRLVKAKVTVKKSRLEKATSHLYDLEDSSGPEKPLNVDLGLYQMENY